MQKLDNDSKENKKFLDSTTIKLTKIFTIISIGLSIISIFILEKTKTYISMFSDNMFISGTILFTISVFFNVIRRISIFINRSYYDDKTKTTKKTNEADLDDIVEDYKKKLFARIELYKSIYKSSLTSGIICYFLSIIGAIFYYI